MVLRLQKIRLFRRRPSNLTAGERALERARAKQHYREIRATNQEVQTFMGPGMSGGF